MTSYGGGGNDTLVGGVLDLTGCSAATGNDRLIGGFEPDHYQFATGDVAATNTALAAKSNGDYLNGGAGDDVLYGHGRQRLAGRRFGRDASCTAALAATFSMAVRVTTAARTEKRISSAAQARTGTCSATAAAWTWCSTSRTRCPLSGSKGRLTSCPHARHRNRCAPTQLGRRRRLRNRWLRRRAARMPSSSAPASASRICSCAVPARRAHRGRTSSSISRCATPPGNVVTTGDPPHDRGLRVWVHAARPEWLAPASRTAKTDPHRRGVAFVRGAVADGNDVILRHSRLGLRLWGRRRQRHRCHVACRATPGTSASVAPRPIASRRLGGDPEDSESGRRRQRQRQSAVGLMPATTPCFGEAWRRRASAGFGGSRRRPSSSRWPGRRPRWSACAANDVFRYERGDGARTACSTTSSTTGTSSGKAGTTQRLRAQPADWASFSKNGEVLFDGEAMARLYDWAGTNRMIPGRHLGAVNGVMVANNGQRHARVRRRHRHPGPPLHRDGGTS